MGDTHLSPNYDIIRVCAWSGLRLAEYLYHPDAISPPHDHLTDHFYLVIDGSCAETDRRETFRADPGTLVFHPAGQRHSNRTSPDGARVFGVEMAPPWRERLQTHAPLLEDPYHRPAGLPTSLARRLYREFREPDDLTALAVEALMLEMLVEGFRASRQDTQPRPPRWLRQVQERLDSRFAEVATLDELARSAEKHPVHLARAFRTHYRCTVGEYVRRRRIQYACRLISNGGPSLGEVALEAGYSDQAHFSRAFKRVTGLTPAQFRDSVRAG